MTAFYATAILAFTAGQAPAADRPGVLVLDDFKLLEGQVTEVPDLYDPTAEAKVYRVTSAGQVRTLRGKSGLVQGASRQEAYRCVKGKGNPTTGDDRSRMAEWCREAGLVAEALAEAKAAAALAPPEPYL